MSESAVQNELKNILETEGPANLVGFMRSHLDLVIGSYGVDIFDLNESEESDFVDCIMNEQPELMNQIFYYAEILCGKDSEQIKTELLTSRLDSTRNFAGVSGQVVTDLHSPKRALRDRELADFHTVMASMAESALDYAFFERLVAVNCDCGDQNLKDLIKLEIQSLKFVEITNQYIDQDIAIFNERNQKDSIAEKVKLAVEFASIPVGIFSGITAVKMREQNSSISGVEFNLTTEQAIMAVLGISGASIAAPNLIKGMISRFRDSSTLDRSLGAFYTTFLQVGQQLGFDQAENHIQNEKDRLYVSLENSTPNLDIARLDLYIASIQKLKSRLIETMVLYDTAQDSHTHKLSQAGIATVGNVLGNLIGIYINL